MGFLPNTIKEARQNYTRAPNHQGEVERELQLRGCAGEGNKSWDLKLARPHHKQRHVPLLASIYTSPKIPTNIFINQEAYFLNHYSLNYNLNLILTSAISLPTF